MTALFLMKKWLTKCIYGGISVYIRYIQYDSKDRGDRLNIIISNSNGKPIYEQITAQIKNAIICGELLAGDPLPSISCPSMVQLVRIWPESRSR